MDYLFRVILGSQLDDRSLHTIAEFLSTDIVQKHDSQLMEPRSSLNSLAGTQSPTLPEALSPLKSPEQPPKKEGYLTKRGKNFGGFQTRYFVLDGPQLRYYDAVTVFIDCADVSQTGFILVASNCLKLK